MEFKMHHLKILFVAFFVCLFCQIGQAQTLGALHTTQQNAKDLVIEKGMSLEQAVKLIEQRFNIVFLYPSGVIEDIHVSNMINLTWGIEKTLESLFEGQELKLHYLNPKTYGISRIEQVNDESITQSIVEEISGRVIDAQSGELLPGVHIRVAGTEQGTSTNVDGEFQMSVPSLQETLLISYIGYESAQIPIDGRSVLEISLQPLILSGEEIVVVGYGTQHRRDLTGSIASVNAEKISELPVPSVSDALQGQAAGLQVVSSGEPGTDATFRIRGTGTINNSDPLLVIDGVPTRSGLNQINPNDIESVQILKDASASAIYGAQGANGVVIVTTKRGEAGHNNVDIRFSGSIQEPTGVVNMLNAPQFAALHNEMMVNNGRQTNPAYSDPESLRGGTDWLGALLQPALMQDYSASYSWGSESANIFVSGNVLRQDGTVIETKFNRYTLQINSDVQILDNLKFGNSLKLNNDVKTSGSYSIVNTMAALPTQRIFNDDGSYAGPTGQPSWSGDVRNPIGEAELIENSTDGYNVVGSLYGELDILDNLQFRTTFGLQLNQWDSRTWSPAYDWDPTPEPHSYLWQQYNKSNTWLWDNTMTYDVQLSDSHQLITTMGTSAQHNRYEFINGSMREFASERTQQFASGTGETTLGGNTSEWALMSFFGRVNYSFRDTYLFTGTVRRDGSSRFGEENRWGVFPSASLAWRVTNEDFFNVSWIEQLKMRVSYGITGNQEIGNYSFASELMPIHYAFNNQPVSAVVPRVMPNPNVQWETVTQANLGFDLVLFNDRVNITLDGYIKDTSDMLVPMSVPISTGYSDIFVSSINAGEIRNQGVELELSTINISRDDLSWTTDFNISHNRNEVVSLNDTIPLPFGQIDFNRTVGRFQAGQPVHAFYGFVVDGLFQTQQEVDEAPTQNSGTDPFNRTSPGDIRFMDLNGDGVINDEDRTFIGDPNPLFIFGITNTFTYKNLDLSVFLQGVYGNDIFNANRIWSEGMAVAQNQTEATLNRWTGPGTSNEMPRAVFNDPNNNTRVSDRYVEDGSYLRIKNLTVGYTLPISLLENLNMRNARVYASAQNLFTLTNYSGFDPEVPINGIDLNVYPVYRTISLGINLSF